MKTERFNEVPCRNCGVINVWPEGREPAEYCANCRMVWPPMMQSDCRYKVAWSKSGNPVKRQESEIITDPARAHFVAAKKKKNNRSVEILKEYPQWRNRGKFFLYLIIK